MPVARKGSPFNHSHYSVPAGLRRSQPPEAGKPACLPRRNGTRVRETRRVQCRVQRGRAIDMLVRAQGVGRRQSPYDMRPGNGASTTVTTFFRASSSLYPGLIVTDGRGSASSEAALCKAEAQLAHGSVDRRPTVSNAQLIERELTRDHCYLPRSTRRPMSAPLWANCRRMRLSATLSSGTGIQPSCSGT